MANASQENLPADLALNEHGESNEQGLFPIRAVAAQTGVNPVTLRAWERRYGLIKPKRTAKGHRLYSEEDILLIKRILDFLDQGIAISQVKGLLKHPSQSVPLPEIEGDTWEQYQQRLNQALSQLDGNSIDATLNDALALYPMEMVTQQLILPTLSTLAKNRSTSASNGCEYALYTAYLRNKIGARFYHQANQSRGPLIQMVCMGGDEEELKLLLFALTALNRGYRAHYLGRIDDFDSLDYLLHHKPGKAYVIAHPHVTTTEYKILSTLSQDIDTAVAILPGRGENQEALIHHEANGENPSKLPVLPADPAKAITTLERLL